MSIRTMFKTMLAVVVITGGLFIANTSTAAAAQGCGGTLLAQYPYAGGYAQVDVYLENGTTNCLVNRTRGSSWGQARWMGVTVGIGDRHPTCLTGQVVRDPQMDCGPYEHWAGPVRIYAPSTCISFWAAVTKANGTTQPGSWRNRHCG